jgi:hypothetical protein
MPLLNDEVGGLIRVTDKNLVESSPCIPILLWQTIQTWDDDQFEFVKPIMLPAALSKEVAVFVQPDQDPEVPGHLFWSNSDKPVQVAHFFDVGESKAFTAGNHKELDYMTNGWMKMDSFWDVYGWAA